MRTFFIEESQLTTMKQAEPLALNHGSKQSIKLSLMSNIKKGVTNWTRLKKETRKAIDLLAFLAAEKGFAFVSPEYLAEKNGITPKSVRNTINKLVDLGEVVILHRRSPNSNGRGKAVYLFTKHKYFERWQTFLRLDFHSDFHTENTDNLTDTRDLSEKLVPTNGLPSSILNNHLYVNHLTTKQIVIGAPYKLQNFAKTFGQHLKTLWLRILLALKRANANLNKLARIEFGRNVLTVVKDYVMKGQAQTAEEQTKLAYVIAKNLLTGKKSTIKHTENKYSFGKVIRREMLPEWFKERQKEDKEATNTRIKPSKKFNSIEEEQQAFLALIGKFA